MLIPHLILRLYVLLVSIKTHYAIIIIRVDFESLNILPSLTPLSLPPSLPFSLPPSLPPSRIVSMQ